MRYTAIVVNIDNFQMKKMCYFCSKQRLWIVVRIASLIGSYKYLQYNYVLSKNKKKILKYFIFYVRYNCNIWHGRINVVCLVRV